MNEVITEVESMIRRPIGEDIQFTTLLTPDLWLIEADPGQLSQVIMNLAVNARDAMPQGGSLTIKTENVTLTKKDGRISPELDEGDYVRLTVKDSGKGIDREMIKRIFDPFFTTKEMGKGTGLGLSSVYGIIAQSKGGIAVHSATGAGTTFEILLPRSQNVNYPKRELSEGVAERSYGSEMILLVEDEKDVRELIEEGLRFHGYQVLVAKTGSEALALYEMAEQPIALLLTDVVLPGMSGHELAQKMQEMNPAIKTLYITGYTDTIIMNHGIGDESVDILQKPFTIGQLTSKINRILASPE